MFVEYLTDDKKKIELIKNFWYKLLDYFFMMFFQYHVIWFIISMLFLYCSHIKFFNIDNDTLTYIFSAISILFMIICEHRVITQRFKVASITQLYQPFSEKPYYKFKYNEKALIRYNMLCSFEDNSFLQRSKSYSFLSIEYIRLFFEKRSFTYIKNRFKIKRRQYGSTSSAVKSVFGRGYSTPEMQLIRTIGVIRGYAKYKHRRKIYELIYSKIFFSSLRKYQIDNSGPGLEHFREYILDIYLKSVLTRINGARFATLSSAFSDSNNVCNWPIEGFFIACLGLSFREVNDYNLYLYNDVIVEYKLDIAKIYHYAEEIKTKHVITCTS
jgi:hypothetical protein